MQKSEDCQDLWGSRNQKYLKTVDLCIALPVEYCSLLGQDSKCKVKATIMDVSTFQFDQQLLPYNNEKLVMDTFITLQVSWEILEYFLKKTEVESWGGGLVCLILVFIKKKSSQEIHSDPSHPRREWHRF